MFYRNNGTISFLNDKKAKVNVALFLSILTISLFISLVPLQSASAATGDYLSLKWAGYVAGGGEALLTYDAIPSIPGEEVFHAGGPVQPSSTYGRVTCLNGRTGAEIWRTSMPGIGDTATIQMGDIDGDGKMEILGTYQHPAGLFILNAEDGSILWQASGTYNGNIGYITPIGGRIDGSGVMGDVDNDGNMDVFIGVMAYEEQPSTGKLIRYEWDPTQNTLVERARTTVWHPCAGGLSLGDTDNDGVFELYMNERHVYFSDGSWGRGTTSFWAENLTKRWDVYDWSASSDIPMLADVNKDGILDVVSINLGTGVCVLNSTDGHPLTNTQGTVLLGQRLGLPVHYQATIYDIDGDGNLEVLCADGKEGNYNETRIWDLWDWKLDGVIPDVVCFRGPSVGEVTGDGVMDIIVVTFDRSTADNGSVQIYNSQYQLMDSYSGLKHRAIGSVVQDVDRNDNGLNEILVLTQGGVIYCFDTPGLSQEKLGNQRPRSEVHFFSESRNGVSEYIPYERSYPDVVSTSPGFGAVNVSTTLNQLSFSLDHPLNQLMSYTVATTPNVGSKSGANVGDGLITVPISGLAASTLYRWQVIVTDQSGHQTSKNYYFITAPYITNSPPTQGTPKISGVYDNNNLVCNNQSTSDINGDKVVNIYNWYKNGVPLTSLNLPFESKPDSEATYSGTAITRDYSSYGQDGTVFGATWVPDGVAGGAFYFDGNDFIRVEEQGNNLGGSGTWSQMSVEFWLKVPNAGSSKPLIWKTDRYDTRNSVSYRVDVCNNNLAQLEIKWTICIGSNSYTIQYNQTSGVADWHHVVCTYKSGVGLKIYMDGTLGIADSSSVLTGNVNGTSGPLEIAFNRGNDFVGYLDEVRIFSSEISAGMINQRYLDTKGGSSSSSTIPSSVTSVGEQWRCQVTPNDAQTDGSSLYSDTVTVLSSGATQYQLTINVQGTGTTNPVAGTYQYASGTGVQVTATPGVGYTFSYWLLDGNNVGNANPYMVTMNANHQLTAVFEPVGTHLFADGFESGNFSAWTGTTTTSGGSVAVVSSVVHQGSYSGQFSITTTSTGARRAYCYENIGSISELYATAYIYIPSSLSLSSGQALWLIQFADSSNSVLASFGIRADSTGMKWAVQSGNYPYAVGSALPSGGGWYLVQAYFTHLASGKTLVLTVNGVEVASLSQNTSAANNVSIVRFGIGYYAGSATTSIYVDDVVIDSQSTPTTKYTLNVSVQGSGSTNPVAGTYQYDAGSTATVTATAPSGWQFNGWLLNGTNVGSTNSYTLTMNNNYNLIAVFTQNPSSVIFADGFESGSFSAWTGTTTTSGGSVAVVSSVVHQGSYSGQFSITTTSTGARRAYCYENIGSITTATASAYVYIADGLPLSSGQNLWLIQFVDSSGSVLASFGIRADSSGSKWAVQSGNYPYALAGSEVSLPSEGSWYLLEAYFTHAASGKTLVLTVNGVEVASLSQDTSSSNNISNVRFGAGFYSGSSTATIYMDDVTVK